MSKFEKYLKSLNEANVTWKKGSELTPEQQKEVKAKYVHRHTGSNKPEWAKGVWKDGKAYPLLHKDDKDWLANTEFAITKKGELCKRTKYCNSSPTYPNNPELRGNHGMDSGNDNRTIKEALALNIKTRRDKGEFVLTINGREAGRYDTESEMNRDITKFKELAKKQAVKESLAECMKESVIGDLLDKLLKLESF